MADQWQTNVVPFLGGLITNESPYQQGFRNPGSARILINYESSVRGGYRRINGYTKAISTVVPFHGDVYVQGTASTGTTLYVANLFETVAVGSTLSIAGVAGTYTVAAISFTEASSTATITLTTSLATNPADKALVTFTSGSTVVEGVTLFDGNAIVCRGGNLYKNAGALTTASTSTDGWTRINTPSFGTLLVSGGSQTGTTLRVDGATKTLVPGVTFQVAGIANTYAVTAVSEVSTGTYDLTISPALASSPADDAAITVVGYKVNKQDGNRQHYGLQGKKYQIGVEKYIAIANGNQYPYYFDDSFAMTVIADIPNEAQYAESIEYFKGSLFLGKDDKVVFSAPFNVEDYTAASGAGVISVSTEVVQLIVFREQVIIFGEESIQRITGSTIADYQLLPITTDLGCLKADSVQEVGSDIMFLGPDGLRLLGATDRIGDFNLDTVASKIQNAVVNLISSFANTRISTVVIRNKSQYRIFATGPELINGKGLLGANLLSPEGSPYWAWSELSNFPVAYADSEIIGANEFVVFVNATGFLYFMDNGNSFDGSNIAATYATPFLPFNDPELRKTMYKMFLYVDPEGSVNITNSMKFDFDDPDLLLPSSQTIIFSNEAVAPASYGSLVAEYGVARYGGSLRAAFKTQLIGSAFAISFFFQSNDINPPYTLDTMNVEYALRGRR